MEMEKDFGQADPRLRDYVERTYHPEDSVLRDVRRRAQAAGLPDIHVSPLDGRHLTTLAAAVGAKKGVEIGTLGGYSGVCLLRGMGPGGFLHTFELEPHHAAIAEEAFRAAGLIERVRVHVGPASTKLADLDGEGPFDLVFIDADKLGYPSYLEWATRNLRAGGVVLLDNAFLFGRVADEPSAGARDPAHDEDLRALAAMRKTHEILARSGAYVATVLPTGEGLALGVRVG